jgi:hypothetical protein
MQSIRITIALTLLAAPLAAQGRFSPSRWDNPGFAAIMAYGERIQLRAESDSGQVPMVGALYWIRWPGDCPPGRPCQVPFFVAAGDATETEPAVVWALGVAGLPQHVQWLPPLAEMHESARLRVRFAMDAPGVPPGSFEDVEFAVGWDTTRVLAKHTGMTPNKR